MYFFAKKLQYLGHEISSEGIRPNASKIQDILKFTKPKTAKEVEQFLGLVGWIRNHIPNLSILAALLSTLKFEKKTFVWTNEQKAAFKKIKTALEGAVKLHYPDFSKPFILETDASNIGVGPYFYRNRTEKWFLYSLLVRN